MAAPSRFATATMPWLWPSPAAADRLPLARQNFVDHSTADQSSALRFIEDNRLGGQRIRGSFDAIANSITQMFDFSQNNQGNQGNFLILDPNTGEPVSQNQP